MGVFIESRAPEEVRRTYLNGACYVLATHLARVTGLPIWGTFFSDFGVHLIHCFLVDEVAGRGFDINGTWPIPAEPPARPMTPIQHARAADKNYVPLTPETLAQAERDAAEWLTIRME